MSSCALNASSNNNGSCLDPTHIALIAEYIDAKNIEEAKEQTKCSDEKCVIEKANIPTEIAGKIIREAFKAPVDSLDKNYWLNNTEIDTIMSQFRRKFPGFAHGFIHMIDLVAFEPANISTFDYPVVSAAKTDFAEEFKHALSKNSSNFVSKLSTYNNAPLKSYAIVCNTDSSKGSGQHWFAIFISTDQKDPDDTSKPWIRIELFNSAGGSSSSKAFNDFWNETAVKISRATGLKCTFDTITNIQHQKSTTGNCGSYSLFYIYARLLGEHPEQFNDPNKPITDYAMEKFRKVCFEIEEKLF